MSRTKLNLMLFFKRCFMSYMNLVDPMEMQLDKIKESICTCIFQMHMQLCVHKNEAENECE